jgi:hypothetical protein
MTEYAPNSEHEIAHAAALIENQLLPGGFLYEVADAKAEMPDGLSANEVAGIVLPEPAPQSGSGVVLEARWTFVESAQAAEGVKAANEANSDRIFETAIALGMRRIKDGERLPEDTELIDPVKAVYVVEGGGNKTSVVRRGVAIKGMKDVYGDDISGNTLYQFGSSRAIPPTRKDSSVNPEHKTIRELAGDFLPEDTFTEFDANVATALAEGYVLKEDANVSGNDLVAKELIMRHGTDPTLPLLILVQPSGPRLEEALDTFGKELEGRQVVLATNGQYRAKGQSQVDLWAADRGVSTLPTVTLGDEPGDSFDFKDGQIVVPNRPESAYVNDFIVLRRLALKQLPDQA